MLYLVGPAFMYIPYADLCHNSRKSFEGMSGKETQEWRETQHAGIILLGCGHGVHLDHIVHNTERGKLIFIMHKDAMTY